MFIDNIFRFTQAGSESFYALAGCLQLLGINRPLAEMSYAGADRIITATDPLHPYGRFMFLLTTLPIRLPPQHSPTWMRLRFIPQDHEMGIYPAVDPLESTSRILDPARSVGQEHYNTQKVKQIFGTTGARISFPSWGWKNSPVKTN